MLVEPTPLAGAHVIVPERIGDERGWFARIYDADVIAQLGLDPAVSMCNLSFNARAGTLRGMHFNAAPHEEDKLVRVQRGAIFDVIVDLRPDSPTYKQWHGVELTAENGHAFFVPKGFAHGFQTLAENTEVHYQMSRPYVPEAGRGVRWDDPAFGIDWPEPPGGERTMSERDANYADFA